METVKILCTTSLSLFREHCPHSHSHAHQLPRGLQPALLLNSDRVSDLLECKVSVLEREKEELVNQVVLLEKSAAVTAKQQEAHVQTLQAEYEAALVQMQERGQVALQQANRCCQELAAQLQSVCSEREEAEKSWRDREKHLRMESEKCLLDLKEKLRENEKERQVMDEAGNKLRKEIRISVQQVEQMKRDAGAREGELR